jgi:type II secretory pathway component PulC
MSIIYEALKKTQQRLKISPSSTQNKINLSWLYLAFIIVGSLGCIFVLFLILYNPQIKLSASIASSKIENEPKATSVQVKSESPQKSQHISAADLPKLSLQLKGIIYMDGSYIALINDKILKTGDFIEGAKVMGISDTRVDLKLREKIFSLGIK